MHQRPLVRGSGYAPSMWYETNNEGVTINLLVQPRASRERVGPLQDERLKVSVSSAPVDGKANQAVVALLAKTFGIRRRDVVLQVGLKGRRKTVLLHGLTEATLLEKVSL